MKGYCTPEEFKIPSCGFWEIVDTQPGVEYASTDDIEFLLVPLPPPVVISSENSNNSVIIISFDDEDKA